MLGEVLDHIVGDLGDALFVVQQRIEPRSFGGQLVLFFRGQMAEFTLERDIQLGAMQLPVGHARLPMIGLTTPSHSASVTV